MSRASSAGVWRAVVTGDGSRTLVHPLHGEACHALAGAWTEARERHARACRLAQLAQGRGPGAAVRLLDVGTGLGLSLAAALEAVEGAGARLEAVTLERDPAPLRAALAAGPDPVAATWHAPVLAALAAALAEPGARVPLWSGGLCLLLGDARVTLPALAPAEPFDAVFFDPFSPAREPELWDAPFLAAVASRMAPEALLSTFSCAARARVGLARAGLRVGPGARIQAKASGTLASRQGWLPPLPPREARRLARALEGLSAPPPHPAGDDPESPRAFVRPGSMD